MKKLPTQTENQYRFQQNMIQSMELNTKINWNKYPLILKLLLGLSFRTYHKGGVNRRRRKIEGKTHTPEAHCTCPTTQIRSTRHFLDECPVTSKLREEIYRVIRKHPIKTLKQNLYLDIFLHHRNDEERAWKTINPIEKTLTDFYENLYET